MKKWSVAILDDEPLAIQMLQEYLGEEEDMHVRNTFENPDNAVVWLNENEVDVLFLDIEMPGMNGFEVLSRLESDQLPRVIFSTAYHHYAIRAFEVNAIDYLLKPYAEDRFKKAVSKLRSGNLNEEAYEQRIQSLKSQIEDRKYPDYLYVRKGGAIESVDISDIIWIKADGDYSIVHTNEKKYVCGMGLGELLKQLDPRKIFRAHRSHAIARPAIKKLEPNGYGGFVAYLKDGTELKISRHYGSKIKENLY